jgi:hypothetical protein
MAQVQVVDGDKVIRFWVRVVKKNNGRIEAEIATNVGDTTKRKTLAGSRRDLNPATRLSSGEIAGTRGGAE